MKMVLVIEVVRKDHAVSSFLGAALILSSRLLVKGGRFLSFFFFFHSIRDTEVFDKCGQKGIPIVL